MSARVRIGVVGAGRMGMNHARVLAKHPGFEFVGVSDLNRWRAQMASWRAGGKAFTDYHDLLAKVDALIVAVPTEHHFEVGLAAIEAGKHVLIEMRLAVRSATQPFLKRTRTLAISSCLPNKDAPRASRLSTSEPTKVSRMSKSWIIRSMTTPMPATRGS